MSSSASCSMCGWSDDSRASLISVDSSWASLGGVVTGVARARGGGDALLHFRFFLVTKASISTLFAHLAVEAWSNVMSHAASFIYCRTLRAVAEQSGSWGLQLSDACRISGKVVEGRERVGLAARCHVNGNTDYRLEGCGSY